MAPYTDEDQLLYEIAVFKRTHPSVIVKRPDECPSGLWEVSFPASATIAFDEPAVMLQCLSMVSPVEDTDEDDGAQG